VKYLDFLLMNNQINKLIPELRFPEFENEGEWKEKKIADIGNVLQGYGFPEIYQGKKSGEYPFIKVSDISNTILKGKNSIGDVVNYINKIELKELNAKAIPIGATIFAKIGEAIRLNRRVLTTCESLIDNNVTGVKAIESQVTDGFIFYTLSRINLIEFSGGLVPSVNKSTLESIPVMIPKSIIEQKKIADCLSSLDELITTHIDKLETLKTYKKGLVQNLFPQVGEKVSKLRFKEFEKDGEWEYLSGNELFHTISNKNHKSDLPILAITQEQGAIPRNLINYNVVVTEKSLESYKVVEIGDFIISLRSFQGGIEYSNYKGICSPAYIILRKKNEYSENEFYKHYFKTDLYIRNLNKNLEGLRDGKMVSYSQFSEILLPNPNSKEQKKIAETLSSLDELIKVQVDKIEQLKLHKKGLMQGLFPKVKN
jgi:type I restriction enzyme S subunit